MPIRSAPPRGVRGGGAHGRRRRLQRVGASATVTAADADRFLADANQTLLRLGIEEQRARWVAENFITTDTEALAARANQIYVRGLARCAKESVKFDHVDVSPDARRQLQLLKVALDGRRASRHQGLRRAREDPGVARRRLRSREVVQGRHRSRSVASTSTRSPTSWPRRANPQELRDVWDGWHAIAPPMRKRLRALRRAGEQGRAGARLRRHRRDVALEVRHAAGRVREGARPPVGAGPAALRVAARLRAHAAAREVRRRGAGRRARSRRTCSATSGRRTGRTSTTSWRPPNADPGYSLDRRSSRRRRSTPVDMVQIGERFFTSLGFAPLPQTFWERSLFVKPRDREVVCHASAWDIDNEDDLRIKMCIEPTDEDFITIHHELGHNFYQRAYNKLPLLFRDSANDGFHEAIGDTIALSVTPEYLKKIGLLDKAPRRVERHRPAAARGAREGRLPAVRPADRSVALGGLLGRDQAGGLQQGLVGPAPEVPGRRAAVGARRGSSSIRARSTTCPANVPYTRYFLARHPAVPVPSRAVRKTPAARARCNRCSIYGNKEAGARLERDARAGAVASRGPTRWRRSPARARWTRRRCSTTSRRCRRGSTSRTRTSRRDGE